MTTFRLTVSMDGAAFEDDPGELGRILAKLGRSTALSIGGAGRVLDINGNTCGEWSIGDNDTAEADRDERAQELEAENAELAAFVDEHPSAEVLDAEELRPLPFAVAIPGQVIAMLRGGEIESLAFMPSGSDAGYSGPAAVLLNGNAGQALTLELDNTAGPFWSAMQAALRADVPIGWEE